MNGPAPCAKRDPAVVADLIPSSAAKTIATAEGGTQKGHFYKPLPKRFQAGGFDYRQIYREGDFAIYEQSNEHSEAFELIHIRRHGGFQIGGRFVRPSEFYPSSKEWGVHGWTLPDKEAAFQKLRALVSPKVGRRLC